MQYLNTSVEYFILITVAEIGQATREKYHITVFCPVRSSVVGKRPVAHGRPSFCGALQGPVGSWSSVGGRTTQPFAMSFLACQPFVQEEAGVCRTKLTRLFATAGFVRRCC